MIPSLLPWQDQQWHRIEQMGSVRGFPHALLLKGRAGVGKALFAQRLAAQLLCLERLSAPCGVCRGCTLVMSGSHPDFHSISPENNTTTITVSQIRELIDAADEQLIMNASPFREDFVVTVWKGVPGGVYSDPEGEAETIALEDVE